MVLSTEYLTGFDLSLVGQQGQQLAALNQQRAFLAAQNGGLNSSGTANIQHLMGLEGLFSSPIPQSFQQHISGGGIGLQQRILQQQQQQQQLLQSAVGGGDMASGFNNRLNSGLYNIQGVAVRSC